jgi:hypothetical protein
MHPTRLNNCSGVGASTFGNCTIGLYWRNARQLTSALESKEESAEPPPLGRNPCFV